jgi:hypothetical protein
MNQEIQLVVCIRNEDYPVSLEPRKIYQVVPDATAKQYHQLRIIDESGEDYLYPEEYFVGIELPLEIEQRLLKVA